MVLQMSGPASLVLTFASFANLRQSASNANHIHSCLMEAVLATALKDTIKKVGYVNHVSLHADSAQEGQYTNAQNATKDTISSIIDVFLNARMDISPTYNQCLVINVQLLVKYVQISPIAKHV